MALFKKSETDKKSKLDSAQKPVSEAPEQAHLPNEQDLAYICQKAQEQIRAIENRIIQERELWFTKTKQKEEEQTALRAHLNVLMFRAEQERRKSEQELVMLQEQMKQDLAEIEQSFEQEIKGWNVRVAQKEKEYDESKSQVMFVEANEKMEADKKIRELQKKLDETRQRYKTLENKLADEKNRWFNALKRKEDEIVEIKTQVALRETQMKVEEEQSEAVRRDMRDSWDAQVRELDESLAKQRNEWTDSYRKKEDELFALKAALEQRLTSIRLETDKQERDILTLNNRLQERIKIIENGLADEKSKWQVLLAEREEEYRKLKVNVMLRESQEKTERESAYTAFKEEEKKADRQLKDIRKRIEEESLAWGRKAALKEEDLKALKIQSELKLKEMQNAWLNKEEEALKEKEQLSKQLFELESKLESEKSALKSALQIKTDEINKFKNEWNIRREELEKNEKVFHERLLNRKNDLQKELGVLELTLKQEKERWQEIIRNKEKEVETYRNELAAKESKVKRELADEAARFAKEQEPLQMKIKMLENLIASGQQGYAKSIAVLEAKKNDLIALIRTKEEEVSKSIQYKEEYIAAEEQKINTTLVSLRHQIEETSHQSMEKVAALSDEERKLAKELSTIEERHSKEKERLCREYEEQERALREKIGTFESELVAYTEKTNKEITAKKNELAEHEKEAAALELKGRDETAKLRKELEALREEETLKLRQLTEELEGIKRQQQQKCEEKQVKITELQKTLRKAEDTRKEERNTLEKEYKEKLQILYQDKNRIAHAYEIKKQALSDELGVIENKVIALKQAQAAKEAEYTQVKEELRHKCAAMKAAYDRELEQVKQVMQEQHKASAETIEKLSAEEDRLKGEIERDKDAYGQDMEREINKCEQNIKHQHALLENIIAEQEKAANGFAVQLKEKETDLKNNQQILAEIEERITAEQQKHDLSIQRLTKEHEEETGVVSNSLAIITHGYQEKIGYKEEAIRKLKDEIKQNNDAHTAELKALQSKYESELKPLLERRNEVSRSIEEHKNSAHNALQELDSKLMRLKEKIAQKDADSHAIETAWKEKIAHKKRMYEHTLRTIETEKERSAATNDQLLGEKEQEYLRLKNELEAAAAENNIIREREVRQKTEALQKMNTENQLLAEELKALDKRIPELLKSKESEMAQLQQQLQEKEEAYKKQIEYYEKSSENYEIRIRRRSEELRENLSTIKEKYRNEITKYNDKISQLKGEYEAKEKIKKEEIAAEDSSYYKKSAVLQQQSIELQEKLKDLKAISQNQFRIKDKEILNLQTELLEKEKTWEQNWLIKEKELIREKEILGEEQELLKTQLKNEESNGDRLIAEKENDLVAAKSHHEIRLARFEDEYKTKKAEHDEYVNKLTTQVHEYTQKYENSKKEWENLLESKEKELAVLNSNLEFWELRSKNEEEKRKSAWEEERLRLEQGLRVLRENIDAMRAKCKQENEQKELELQTIKQEYADIEKKKTEQWQSIEEKLENRKADLVKEVETWEKRIQQETVQYNGRIKSLERNIEKAKLEGALKETAQQSEWQKAEREWLKLQRRLADQLNAVEYKSKEEADEWLHRIHLKDEEISTLKVRLDLREERLKSEAQKRQEEATRMIHDLETQVQALLDTYNKKVPLKKDIIEKFQEELKEIKILLDTKEKDWKKRYEEQGRTITERYRAIDTDIKNMEEMVASESKRFASLLLAKDDQIKSLTEMMQRKEEDLVKEREKTAEITMQVKTRYDELRRVLLKASSHSISQNVPVKSFEKAVDLFNHKKYQEAKENLEAMLKTHAKYSGTYQYLALCNYELGLKEDAIEMAETALELAPHNEELAAWLESIKTN